MLKFSAWLACVTGFGFIVWTIAIRLLDIQTNIFWLLKIFPFPFWANLLTGFALLGSGLITFRCSRQDRTLLCATWGLGLTVSLFWFLLLTVHTVRIPRGPELPVNEIVGLAILIGIALLGWMTSVLGNEARR